MKPRKILICGLPGSGKTTLALALQKLIPGSLVYDGDTVRAWSNNSDFSVYGREQQATLMGSLCDHAVDAGLTAIASFVCPTEITRKIFAGGRDTFVIWMDTIAASAFQDTNKLWQDPKQYDFHVTMPLLPIDVHKIKTLLDHVPPTFDWKQPTALMIGRYQPWHVGHRELFKRALLRYGQVCILVRLMPVGTENPYEYDEVIKSIHADLQPEFGGRYHVTSVPNTAAVVYGRDVGYTVARLHLDKDIEAVSASQIRRTGANHDANDQGC